MCKEDLPAERPQFFKIEHTSKQRSFGEALQDFSLEKYRRPTFEFDVRNIKQDFVAGKPDQILGSAKTKTNFERRIDDDDDPRLLHASSTIQSVSTWPGSGGKLKMRGRRATLISDVALISLVMLLAGVIRRGLTTRRLAGWSALGSSKLAMAVHTVVD
ncbi:hypothetical protein DFH08DRAFT_802699 [Mycena albidolilacea]|uniref:Uncharacterized protein n=1 Tax=Mycena albidolilacea TaxID=1033008 RepID=A0AAD7AEN2_9AGAR|nr:hypothetical protein DFH08DRAFT_802699 [Mycena albidolilacea]